MKVVQVKTENIIKTFAKVDFSMKLSTEEKLLTTMGGLECAMSKSPSAAEVAIVLHVRTRERERVTAGQTQLDSRDSKLKPTRFLRIDTSFQS